jgi:SAM-dependent methyltransferase
LLTSGYQFITSTPETHRRVEARARAAGRERARTVRDVFGRTRPFDPRILPAPLLELARRAEILDEGPRGLVSRVRFSTLHDRIFVHSAYPTDAADSVFFGPDTYRFCDLLAAETAGRSFRRAVDVGCGSGAGGILVAEAADAVVLGDISERALGFAAVNAALAGVADKTVLVRSDVLGGVEGAIDLVIANPPYLVDPLARAYRHGGGSLGEALAVRIVDEALARLSPGGLLVLYTGAAIVDGVDILRAAVVASCERAGAAFRYRELDPDVFGEEIEQNPAYADVERIAAVALVATVATAPS